MTKKTKKRGRPLPLDDMRRLIALKERLGSASAVAKFLGTSQSSISRAYNSAGGLGPKVLKRLRQEPAQRVGDVERRTDLSPRRSSTRTIASAATKAQQPKVLPFQKRLDEISASVVDTNDRLARVEQLLRDVMQAWGVESGP